MEIANTEVAPAEKGNPRFASYRDQYYERFIQIFPNATEEQRKKAIEVSGVWAKEKIELEDLADHDALTGLLNKRAITQTLQTKMQAYQRENFKTASDQASKPKPLAVLILDGDGIKAINDQINHSAGDIAISRLAKIIKTSASRASDFAGRTGGDEFLLLLEETDLFGALTVAEEVRHNVAQDQEFPGLSVSIGITLYSGETSLDKVINNADKAMYRAKEHKNAIAIHPEDLPTNPHEITALTTFIKERGIQVATKAPAAVADLRSL